MIKIEKKYYFYAGHRNKLAGEKCGRLHGHTEQDPLCDILDFHNEPYRKLPFETSAENMAIWIFNRIKNESKLNIKRIELAETKSSTVIYEQ